MHSRSSFVRYVFNLLNTYGNKKGLHRAIQPFSKTIRNDFVFLITLQVLLEPDLLGMKEHSLRLLTAQQE